MKKTRNTFFSESNFQSYNPNMVGMPYQASSNYYYGGDLPQNNYNINNQGIGSDLEARISKIERQINRIDYRLQKLENNSNVFTKEDLNTTNNTNMYMI